MIGALNPQTSPDKAFKGFKHLPTCLRIHFNSYEGLELVVGCFVIFVMEPEGVYNKH